MTPLFAERQTDLCTSPSLVVYIVFPLTLIALAILASTPSSSATLYVLAVFANGFATGAALNYTLAHLLHLTPSHTHYIATSLIATFRGFAGSFGSAVGGGIFTRILRDSLDTHFHERGLGNTKDGLVRRLLGSPALVDGLDGIEREVAVQGYQDALRYLWLAAAALAVVVVFIQASTGWKGAKQEKVLEDEAEEVESRNQEDSTR